MTNKYRLFLDEQKDDLCLVPLKDPIQSSDALTIVDIEGADVYKALDGFIKSDAIHKKIQELDENIVVQQKQQADLILNSRSERNGEVSYLGVGVIATMSMGLTRTQKKRDLLGQLVA